MTAMTQIAQHDGLPLPRRYWAIATLSCGTALVVLDGAIPVVALPTIARELRVTSSETVLIVTVYQLVLVMTLLPFSALGDRLGLKRLYSYGLIVFTIATALCFFARSLPFLIVVRIVQALGAAATLSMTSALVRSIYPSRQLGRGLGVNGVIVASSTAIAPTIGGYIAAVASWPWVFAAAAPFGLLSLLGGRNLPGSEPSDEPYDYFSALMCALTFGLVVSGLETAVHGGSPVISAAIFVTGLLIGYFFVRQELCMERPVMPVDLLARPVLALSALGAFAAFMGAMTFLLAIPFRLESVYHFSSSEVGTMMAAWPMASLVIAPSAGILSDRIPAGLLGAIGMVIAVIGLMLIAFLPIDATPIGIAWRLAMTGGGFGLFLSPNARLLVGSAPRHRAASAGGLIATIRLLGQTFGATLAAFLLALGLGAGRMPAMVSAVLATIAGVCSIARLRPAIANPRPQDIPEL